MKKKIFLIISIILVIISVIIINLNHKKIKFIEYGDEILEHNLPQNIYVFIKLIFNNKINTLRTYNDYNVKFLPETQFINVKFKKIKISEVDKVKAEASPFVYYNKRIYYSYYLSRYKNNLFLAYKDRKILYINTDELNYSKPNFKTIKHNLNGDKFQFRDMIISNGKIFISTATELNDKCTIIEVYSAYLDVSKNLEFKNLFTNSECLTWSVNGGQLEIWEHLGQNSILLSMSGDERVNGIETDPKPQDDKSLYGKILIINEKDGKYEIFSKGHRNTIGLYADISANIILNTENGPRGGDEINLIQYGKNYGWDTASYGKKYVNSNDQDELIDYKLSHEDNNFEEPIFAFVPSIGISEIIKIENNFSKQWFNNFLIASLNSGHIYRFKFNNNFTKTIFYEKIFIGERVRDLYYLEDKKQILLALERSNALGILELKN